MNLSPFVHDHCLAPLSYSEVRNLEDWQAAGPPDQYLCKNDRDHRPLVPSTKGLVCPDCGHVQTWAHFYITSGAWRVK